jgi:GT2 family glycosyltransferase
VVTWNGLEDTLRALEALTPQLAEVPGSAVILVDNGSTDGTPREIGRRFPAARVIRLPENRGFTGGVDAGVAASVADFVLLLNNDAVPEAGWLREMVTSIEAAPADVIAVGGKILDNTGTLTDFIGGILTFDGHAFQRHFRRPVEEVPPPSDGSEILFACGGNLIARRREFVDLGAFDDDYFAYLEDVDFGWRAWVCGYRVLYNDRAVVRHRSSATSDRLGNYERGVLFERNALQTALKNFGDENLRQFAGPIFLALLSRMHTYTTSRNAEAGALTRPPLGDKTPQRSMPPAGSLLSRLRRRLGARIAGRPGAVVIDDPLTMMQFRAMEWLFQHSEQIMSKRRSVQERRRRDDAEIFDRFPLHYVPTYAGDSELMRSSLFRLLQPPVRSREATLEEVMRL